MLLEYIEDVDDKLFKKYSHRKNFNSFINEFDCATNKEDKEKIGKKLKEINSLVNHYTQWEEIWVNTRDVGSGMGIKNI